MAAFVTGVIIRIVRAGLANGALTVLTPVAIPLQYLIPPVCWSMNIPVIRYPDGFTLAYLPDEHLLIGRWLRPATLPELQAHYAEMLQAAQAHGHCRHWLLDVRRRTINDPDAVHWFGEEFGPKLPAVLGQPVVIAYFARVGQDVATTDPALWENIRQGTFQGANYHYFDLESEALAWLRQQP
jgi:hypothetical protein